MNSPDSFGVRMTLAVKYWYCSLDIWVKAEWSGEKCVEVEKQNLISLVIVCLLDSDRGEVLQMRI